MNVPEDEMTATGVFFYNLEAAKLEYLLDKKRRGQPATRVPVVHASMVPLAPSGLPVTQELPSLLKRQAD